MATSRLAELREKLLHDKALPPVWRFFLDHLGEDETFVGGGEPTDSQFLLTVLAQVARQLYPASAAITDIRLVRLAEEGFIHGGFSIDGRVGGLLYFEEPDTGLIVICELPPSIDVKYVRFRTKPLRPLPKPSVN